MDPLTFAPFISKERTTFTVVHVWFYWGSIAFYLSRAKFGEPPKYCEFRSEDCSEIDRISSVLALSSSFDLKFYFSFIVNKSESLLYVLFHRQLLWSKLFY